uniref:Uncharacterized protein n=1 Tax=Treubia lacunosa TaxID=93845 RepID=G4Y9R2_9MARC|nr:hypothetical protein TrlaMp13 [Treubia lacunosa]AEH99708.1 hypothetical protein TrlaMp13 [Treubia lacunosa]
MGRSPIFHQTPDKMTSIWDQSRVGPSLTNRIEDRAGINAPHAAGLRCAPGRPVTGLGPAREKVQVHDVLRHFTYPAPSGPLRQNAVLAFQFCLCFLLHSLPPRLFSPYAASSFN